MEYMGKNNVRYKFTAMELNDEDMYHVLQHFLII
jgi:hypothetical protein